MLKPLLWSALLLLSSQPALADPFGTFGFGARGSAMAGAQAAAAEDYSGVFYNPATLTVRKKPHAGLGISVVAPNLGVTPDSAGGPDRGQPMNPKDNVGVQVGVLFPLGGLIENRFALGIGLHLPAVQVTRVNAVDPETPNYYRYGALTDKMAVNLAMAFELHETVSFGVGYQVLGALDGVADVELDPLTQRFTRKELRVDVESDSGIIAGVLLRPDPSLRLGFTYRAALQLDYRLLTLINIKDVGVLSADIFGTALYTPQTYVWGGAWQWGDLLVAFDLAWARWSEAPSPASRFEVLLETDGLGLEPIAASPGVIDLGAVDTISPKLGFEYHFRADWIGRLGYAYDPTPLPAQQGYTNFVDSDTHIFGMGVGYSFQDPLRLHRAPLSVDLAVQLHHVTERRADKVDPNDSFGSYSAGGQVWQVALAIRHDFD